MRVKAKRLNDVLHLRAGNLPFFLQEASDVNLQKNQPTQQLAQNSSQEGKFGQGEGKTG